MTAGFVGRVAASERKLVALDIDGTLVHPDETVTEVVLEQVRRVVALGHEVMLATGRSWEGTESVLAKLGVTPEFVVCANGALTMQRDLSELSGYRRERVETFDPADTLRRIRPHLPRGSYMVEDPTGFRRYTEGMSDWNLSNAVQVNFDDLISFPATRVVVVSPGHEKQDFLDLIGSLGLSHVSYSIGWTAWMDIAPRGVNKASALEQVRRDLNIAPENLVAVGDGHNDVEMLSWAARAGRGVAMGGSPDEVVAVANEVTRDVYEDGVADVLASL